MHSYKDHTLTLPSGGNREGTMQPLNTRALSLGTVKWDG